MNLWMLQMVLAKWNGGAILNMLMLDIIDGLR